MLTLTTITTLVCSALSLSHHIIANKIGLMQCTEHSVGPYVLTLSAIGKALKVRHNLCTRLMFLKKAIKFTINLIDLKQNNIVKDLSMGHNVTSRSFFWQKYTLYFFSKITSGKKGNGFWLAGRRMKQID